VQRIKQVPAGAKLRLERARADYPVVDVTVATFKRYSEDDAGFYAAALTYYMFFSIFPILIFAASAIGYITFLNEDLQERLIAEGLNAIPLIGDILTPDSIGKLQQQRGTLALVGLALTLYSGSGAIVALEHALNKVNRVDKEPPFIAKRIRSLKWLGALAIAAVLSLGISGFAQFVGELLPNNLAGTVALSFVLHVAGAALGVAIFLTTFKLLPAAEQTWRDVLPGALLAGVVFEVLKTVGTLYLARGQAGREATFGAFATAATLLVASYLLAQITLLAAELNAVLAERRQTRQSSVGVEKEGM
jgi:YihY family inner membrane protein